MEIPLQISLHGIAQSDALHNAIREKAERLNRYYDHIMSCRVVLEEFHIRRVSNAKGPLVRELSDSVRKLLADELDGPELTAKINRAVEKNRDRLALSPSDWLAGARRPMSESPALAPPLSPPAVAAPE